MDPRRWLIAIALFATALNIAGVSRTLVPAQDGLKFLTAARQFQTRPMADVVRGTDQHPLYPALVALAEPVAARLMGPGPETWRITAQGVSFLASLFLLIPLYHLARALFDERVALIAVFIYILLPVPAEVGRDVLANAVGLCATTLSLWLGARAIRSRRWPTALAAGLAGGVGFLARPEAILAPLAVGLAWCARAVRTREPRALFRSLAPAALAVGVVVCVGSYAMVKGQVSEKLALRRAATLGASATAQRSVPQLLPEGLDGTKLDLSPKEESDHVALGGPARVLIWVVREWWDELCWGFAVMAIWGLARQRFIRGLCKRPDQTAEGAEERLVLGVFAAVHLTALLRHGSTLGYLSGRHVLPLVIASMPWVAAGTFVCLRGLGLKLSWSPRAKRAALVGAAGVVIAVLSAYQLRTSHESRRGHWEAGRWLAQNAKPGDRVLDTRGWARFVADKLVGYDYWHVRQALSDQGLAFVVVGRDELEADSPRARTLGALLAYAATPVQDFPVRVGKRDVGARIYRVNQPISWEGFAP